MFKKIWNRLKIIYAGIQSALKDLTIHHKILTDPDDVNHRSVIIRVEYHGVLIKQKKIDIYYA